MMKTYTELIEIVNNNKEEITALLDQAHRQSLQADQTDSRCSIVAVGRQNGAVVHEIIDEDQQREDLYVLAAYPHINPIEAVVLYADEKTAILNNWCSEQGTMAPEQGEDEGDVAYLARLIAWIREYTNSTAGEILTTLIRDQLLADFDADREIDDALEELSDLSQGIVRLPPEDDDETGEAGQQ
ncbi:MAG: hypothetical protein SCM11_19050 [Bacillota bacterium]|nr:hypothetical protein [Bacillota bacterium]